MQRTRLQHLLMTALLLGASPAIATSEELKPDVVSGSASISGIAQFNTKLDGGGNFHWGGIIAQAELKRQITAQMSAGISARYGYESWHFSTPSVLGATAPWGSINRPGIGLNFGYQAAPDVALFVAPQIEWNYETGASAGDAKNYGAVIGATKFFSPTLVLGLGAGAFRQIDKTVVFPFVIVNWKIDDHWRLSNPFQAGPAGGAGLELVYTIDPQWEIAGGASYREYRFRLRDDGPIPRGIGRNQGVPVFARLTRKVGPRGRVDFYAGAVAGGQLRVLNANGSTAASSDYKLSPLLGFTAALDF